MGKNVDSSVGRISPLSPKIHTLAAAPPRRHHYSVCISVALPGRAGKVPAGKHAVVRSHIPTFMSGKPEFAPQVRIHEQPFLKLHLAHKHGIALLNELVKEGLLRTVAFVMANAMARASSLPSGRCGMIASLRYGVCTRIRLWP